MKTVIFTGLLTIAWAINPASIIPMTFSIWIIILMVVSIYSDITYFLERHNRKN